MKWKTIEEIELLSAKGREEYTAELIDEYRGRRKEETKKTIEDEYDNAMDISHDRKENSGNNFEQRYYHDNGFLGEKQ